MATSTPNTMTGDIVVKSTVSADFNNEPGSLDADLVAKFTKSLISGTAQNFNRIQGQFTPANDLKTIASFVSSDAIKGFILFTDLNIGVRVTMDHATLTETTVIDALPVNGALIFRPGPRKGYFLNDIVLVGQTGYFDDPADVDQGQVINYVLYTWEEA